MYLYHRVMLNRNAVAFRFFEKNVLTGTVKEDIISNERSIN